MDNISEALPIAVRLVGRYASIWNVDNGARIVPSESAERRRRCGLDNDYWCSVGVVRQIGAN